MTPDPYNNPPESLRFIIPFLPPTSNHIYVTNWKRKLKFLSKEAKAFQEKFQQEVVPNYLPWISRMVGPEQDDSVLYEVSANFYFERWDLLNKGWFQTDGGKRKAKTRYKKMDTGNRFKLIFDCVAKAIGIDDSHFFATGGRKLAAEPFGLTPQVHVFIIKRSPLDFGL